MENHFTEVKTTGLSNNGRERKLVGTWPIFGWKQKENQPTY